MRQGGEPHAQRQREGHRVERMLGRLAQPVENAFAESRRDQRQERREAEVDHNVSRCLDL